MSREEDGFKIGILGAIIGAVTASIAWILADPEKRERVMEGVNTMRDKTKEGVNKVKEGIKDESEDIEEGLVKAKRQLGRKTREVGEKLEE